nr:MAG TPA: hypothetical protein [Caudoviricetes sp.]
MQPGFQGNQHSLPGRGDRCFHFPIHPAHARQATLHTALRR